MSRPAVFLDKDGTLVVDQPYNVDPAQVRFAPGALAACRLLHQHGHALVIVSNQPGVALGRFDLAALDRLRAWLHATLAAAGAPLTAVLCCPHAPAADGRPTCACRKPMPGLLLQAAQAHHLDLGASWMIGDILDDVEAGSRAGCRTVLLEVGHETVWQPGAQRVPHRRARHLLEAARHVIAGDRRRRTRAPATLAALT